MESHRQWHSEPVVLSLLTADRHRWLTGDHSGAFSSWSSRYLPQTQEIKSGVRTTDWQKQKSKWILLSVNTWDNFTSVSHIEHVLIFPFPSFCFLKTPENKMVPESECRVYYSLYRTHVFKPAQWLLDASRPSPQALVRRLLPSPPEHRPLCVLRDTAANDESMAAAQFTNLLSQMERVRSQEQNFLQRHNMKIIQQQLQVGRPSFPTASGVLQLSDPSWAKLLKVQCVRFRWRDLLAEIYKYKIILCVYKLHELLFSLPQNGPFIFNYFIYKYLHQERILSTEASHVFYSSPDWTN